MPRKVCRWSDMSLFSSPSCLWGSESRRDIDFTYGTRCQLQVHRASPDLQPTFSCSLKTVYPKRAHG